MVSRNGRRDPCGTRCGERLTCRKKCLPRLTDYGWLRWPGGILIALAIGAIMVYRKPDKQGTFVFSIALGTLLAGLGMLYSLIRTEYSGTTIFITIPTVLILVLSGFIWWGRQRAKAVL